MKTAVVSVTNDLVSDQRIHRTASFLEKSGYEVILAGRKLKNSLPYKGQFAHKRFSLIFNKGPFFYAEYNIRLFIYLLFKNPFLYFSNDLDTLPANFLASSFHGQKLIYDSHELFTEVPELNGRPFVKKIWQKIEAFILPKLTEMITVCDSVADYYRNKYGIKVHVVRNLPVQKASDEKKNLNQGDKKVIIYQGSLNVDRGIEDVIRAMKYLDDYLFLVIGTGDIDEKLKSLVKAERVEEKVVFTGKIPLNELHSYTLNGHFGISLEKDTNLNYRYALPNKLFDYIQARIPVFVSDLPEMRKIVEDYNLGVVCISREPKELADQITSNFSNPDIYKAMKVNTVSASNHLCWESEEIMLKNII